MRGAVVLIATLLIQAMASMATVTMPVLAAGAGPSLNLGSADLGRYMLCVYAGAMCASVLAGYLIVRLGPIRASQVALVCCGAGLATSALGRAWLPLGGLLLGLGYGPITPASSELLARTTPPERRNLVFSIKQTGVPIGGALAGLLVPVLLRGAEWRPVLLTLAAASLVCALLAQPIRRELDQPVSKAGPARLRDLWAPVRIVWTSAILRRLAFVSLLFSGIQLCLTTYLTVFLVHDFAMDLAGAGLCLALAQLAGVAGRIVWGWLSDRFLGAARVLRIQAAVVVASALTLYGASLIGGNAALVSLPVICVAFGLSAIGWNGVFLAEVAARCPPGQAGAATAGSLAFTFIGVMLGATSFGYLAEHWLGFTGSFAALALPALLIIFLMRVPVASGRSTPIGP